MAVVHSDVARLRQMGGSQPQMYVSGTCDVRLSVVGAMGRSWYSRWGEFQQMPAPPFNVQSPPITANYNWSHRMSIVACRQMRHPHIQRSFHRHPMPTAGTCCSRMPSSRSTYYGPATSPPPHLHGKPSLELSTSMQPQLDQRAVEYSSTTKLPCDAHGTSEHKTVSTSDRLSNIIDATAFLPKHHEQSSSVMPFGSDTTNSRAQT
jgi:hypothetical protein